MLRWMALLARNIHVKLNKCWYFGIMFCRDTPGDTSNVCACSVTSVMSGPVTPWILAHQALLSIGFSRQEYWSGLSCPFRESSWPRDWTPFSYVSCIGRLVLYHWATKKALILSNIISKKKKKKKERHFLTFV